MLSKHPFYLMWRQSTVVKSNTPRSNSGSYNIFVTSDAVLRLYVISQYDERNDSFVYNPMIGYNSLGMIECWLMVNTCTKAFFLREVESCCLTMQDGKVAIDAMGRRIGNVEDPKDKKDVVTKRYIETKMGEFSAQVNILRHEFNEYSRQEF